MRKRSFALVPKRVSRGESTARQRLVSAAKKLLVTHAPSDITSAMVLKQARVARGTLYTHFEGLSALIEIALLGVFVDGVNEHAHYLERLILESRSRQEFVQRSMEVMRLTQSRERGVLRIARCRLIAHADSNPHFMKLLGDEQAHLTDKFVALFKIIKSRGWTQKDIDPVTAAVLVQALTLGRVIDDVSSKKVNEENWNRIFMKIVAAVILDVGK
jgi:AcrR family transcriptional regulator